MLGLCGCYDGQGWKSLSGMAHAFMVMTVSDVSGGGFKVLGNELRRCRASE